MKAKDSQQAFTLIEVMVVLSILARVAVLAYSYFGSTLREAKLTQRVTQIYETLRVLSDAEETHYMKYGSYAPAGYGAGDWGFAGLVDKGILKTLPEVNWIWADLADYGGPTAAADYAVFLYDDTDPNRVAVCQEFNRRYSQTIGDALATSDPYGGNIVADEAQARANVTYCGLVGPDPYYMMLVDSK